MRRIAPNVDRRVLTSAAVTATAIAVLSTVGLSVDNSPPDAPEITPLAESGPQTSTSDPTTAASTTPETTDPTSEKPAPEDDPGAVEARRLGPGDGPEDGPDAAVEAAGEADETASEALHASKVRLHARAPRVIHAVVRDPHERLG